MSVYLYVFTVIIRINTMSRALHIKYTVKENLIKFAAQRFSIISYI